MSGIFNPFSINGLGLNTPAEQGLVPWYGDSANRVSTIANLSGFAWPQLSQGRLTAESGVPVSTSDVTAAGTLYYTPFNGSSVTTYDTTYGWILHRMVSQLSLALTLTANKNYDVFIYSDGALALELSSAWTNDTTRADSIVLRDGVYVLATDLARKWLGTIRASGTNIIEDSKTKRFVMNGYNQVQRPLFTCPGYANDDSQTTWTTNSTTYGAANGGTGSKIEFLTDGLRPVLLDVRADVVSSGATTNFAGIGVDSTTSAAADCAKTGTTRGSISCMHAPVLPEGYHAVNMLARVGAASTATFIADSARGGSAADPPATYLNGLVWG